MTKPIRVAIAGYGVVGKRRRHYIDEHPDMQVVALCDRLFEGTEDVPGMACFHTYQELIDGAEFDALFVSLPNYLAAKATIAGLQAGLHVFCEKPPGRTVEDIESVIELASQNPHLKLKYGFNHRYHNSVMEALELVESGELGEIINVRGVYGKSKIIPIVGDEELDILSGWRASREYAGGGILLDQGIHMLDLMRLFCGDFVEIKSFISNEYWQHDVEDNAYAIMRDKQGRIAMLHSSATQWQHRFSMDIAMSEGYIALRGILSGSKSYGQETLEIGRREAADVGSLRKETVMFLDDESWAREIDEFATAILQESPILNGTSADALAVMKLVHEIYRVDEDWRSKFNI